MPATKCNECGVAHRLGGRCVYHDPRISPSPREMKRLREHRGLPEDCPGCLGDRTIEQRAYGKRAGDFILRCRACRQDYFMSVSRRRR